MDPGCTPESHCVLLQTQFKHPGKLNLVVALLTPMLASLMQAVCWLVFQP